MKVCLGLGSNVEPRLTALIRARKFLSDHPDIEILQSASLYESEPWGVSDQPLFYNTALFIETPLDPRDLLLLIKRIEEKTERTPSFRWGPREIDIDLLFADDIVLRSDELTLPHRYFLERSFAFYPALELWPDWIHPDNGRSLSDLNETLTFSTSAVPIATTW